MSRPVHICMYLYIYMYMNTYRYVHSGAENLRLSWRSNARVVNRCNQSQRLDENLNRGYYPRDTVTWKQIRASQTAKAGIVQMPKEERAWPTAGQQFMAELDFSTGKNVVLPFPLAREERCLTLQSIVYVSYYAYNTYINQCVSWCLCILYVYTDLDTYRYVLYE